MTTPVATRDPVCAAAKPFRYVALLFLVSAVSFMDRQILSILLEPIKRELGASDTEMGLLTRFAFVLFFAFAPLLNLGASFFGASMRGRYWRSHKHLPKSACGRSRRRSSLSLST